MLFTPAYASFGETIQIYTQLQSIDAIKPSWLILIRDVDHNQMIPYLLDLQPSHTLQLYFTYSKNYQIIASVIQMSHYQADSNQYRQQTIHNVCQIETGDNIITGKSIYITLQGALTADPTTLLCHVSTYAAQ